jgi:hypothetical protein
LWLKMFKLYCMCTRATTIGDLWRNNKQLASRVDPQKFAVFGVLNGIIRRVHKYPMKRAASVKIEDSVKKADMTELLDSKRGRNPSNPTTTTTPPHMPTSDQTGRNLTLHREGNSVVKSPSMPTVSLSSRALAGEVALPSRMMSRRNREASDPTFHSTQGANKASDAETEQEVVDTLNKELDAYLDGSHCYDEICCHLEVPKKLLDNIIHQQNDDLIIRWH